MDLVVVGAGIAGITVAAEFARSRSVVLLEADTGPAQQTTGRSAATYVKAYGGPAIQPFNEVGREWLASGGGGRLDRSLLSPRGLVVIATPGTDGAFDHFVADGARRIDAAEAVARFPAIRPDQVADAMYDPDVLDIDAAGAVAAARQSFRESGGELRVSSRVTGLRRGRGAWQVTTELGELEAGAVVNAAGAWSDALAAMAGLPRIGMQPLRRTICTFPAPAGLRHEQWPMLLEASERFYLKPESGQFLASPADETPSDPGDPRPEMLDVATAIDRVQTATTLVAETVTSAWAGLRTFAPDRSLVLGPDPLERSFIWCAGHGGFGIQAAHPAARAVVALTDRGALPDDLLAAGARPTAVMPDRFRG